MSKHASEASPTAGLNIYQTARAETLVLTWGWSVQEAASHIGCSPEAVVEALKQVDELSRYDNYDVV